MTIIIKITEKLIKKTEKTVNEINLKISVTNSYWIFDCKIMVSYHITIFKQVKIIIILQILVII